MGLRTYSLLVLLVVAGSLAQETALPTTTTAEAVTTTPADPTETPTDAPTDAPTTTTAAPSNSTTEAPTPSPAPKPDDFFRVTKDGVTCVMFSADVKFNIEYPTTLKTKLQATVRLPKPSNDKESVSTDGTCEDPQSITVNWGPTNTRSSFTLMFNSTGEKWSLVSTEANLYMDQESFANASDAGAFLKVSGVYPGLSFVEVDTNSSYICRSAIDSKNFTGEVLNSNNTYTVTGSAIGFKGQAYNAVPHDTDLQTGTRCEADETSDLVPIAVGCALAGLVVLVLISYLVGRRRRSAAYQSV